MSGEIHIASLVVQHRAEAVEALDAALGRMPDVELALREGTHSIVVCEVDRESLVLDRIDVLRAVDGVYGVHMVHHHAEDRQSLLQEMPDADTP